MLRKIYLEGSLGEKFQKEIEMDVNSVAEVSRALCSQFPGFGFYAQKEQFNIFIGDTCIDTDDMILEILDDSPIRIIPVIAGHGSDNGFLKLILGIAFIGVGVAVGFGAIGAGYAGAGWCGTATLIGVSANTWLLLGAGMFLSGLGMMLSPSSTIDSNESADNKPSYKFNTAQNLVEEGNCIPVVYGRTLCGSMTLSCALTVADYIG